GLHERRVVAERHARGVALDRDRKLQLATAELLDPRLRLAVESRQEQLRIVLRQEPRIHGHGDAAGAALDDVEAADGAFGVETSVLARLEPGEGLQPQIAERAAGSERPP